MKINDRILAALATTAVGAAAVFAIGANTGLLFGKTVGPPATLASSDVAPPDPVVIVPQTAEAPPQSVRLAGAPPEAATTTAPEGGQSPMYQGVLDTPVPAVDPAVDSPQDDTPQVDSPEDSTPQVDSPQDDTPQVDTPQVDSPSSNEEPESWSEEDDSEDDDSSTSEEDDQTQVEEPQEKSYDSKQETSDRSREKQQDHEETEHEEEGDD